MKALTSRGRAFIAGGLTAAACGVLLGERDLVRIGVLVVLIPLVTLLLSARTGQRLSLVRTVGSTVVEVGQTTTVTLDVTNVGRRSGLLQFEEQVPWALGHRPRFLLGWLGPGRSRRVQYPIRAEIRGRYELGPLVVRATDPFGMVSSYRSFPQTTTVIAVPTVEELPSIGSIGAWGGAGDNRPQPFTIGSAADSTVREYRLGDDLRRVHWRSTARTGELMVRREEQPWQSSCTLLVDNRAEAHRGSGPDSSLERAISVAASTAVHLSRSGYQVHLVSADGSALDHSWSQHLPSGADAGDPTRPLLEFLAGLPSATSNRLTLPRRTDSGSAHLFVSVLGALDEHARDALVRSGTPGGSSYAISLDVDTWSPRTPRQQTSSSTSFLRARGWSAVDLARGASLPTAWTELGR